MRPSIEIEPVFIDSSGDVLANTSPLDDTVEVQQSESSNPVNYFMDNPVKASVILGIAVTAGLFLSYANRRSARDKIEQEQNF